MNPNSGQVGAVHVAVIQEPSIPGPLGGSPAPGAEDEYDNEPSTQPMSEDDKEVSSLDESMEADAPEVYGYLLPYKPKGPMIELVLESFTVGRSVKANHRILPQTGQVRFKHFDAISKVQFALIKDKIGVFLEDRSSNGTYVNRTLVGRSKRVLLSHNDKIGVTEPKAIHFIYMHSNQDQYPIELTQKYTVAQELGKGACGTVMLGVRKEDSTQVAIKIIKKKEVALLPSSNKGNVLNEVKMLRAIEHPCVIRLEDAIETPDTLYIILELADGGELFDKIIEKTRFQENEAKLYFYQIVSAVEFMHSKNIAHRDLKPENILLVSDDESRPLIKITDLGLSKFVDFTTHLKTFCGTPQYLAPEVLFSRVRGSGIYDHKVDMWSLGVILYILLCGCPPFNPMHPKKSLVQQVTDGDYSFPESQWASISPEAIDLVTQLMTVDPKKRLGAAEALVHPWLADKEIQLKAEALMRPNVNREPATSIASKTRSGVSALFKRPAEEANGGQQCKRTKQ
ncbi:myosin light chain kinase A-like [Tigriopus californicus]|uniref:myosin light chain kinase A-like n=1 Tax=Tigriopus californicus TaxID=6832 RepID=UPI0027DA272E|nr:myosin light chain kinase A-like [Tigriopus californicus]